MRVLLLMRGAMGCGKSTWIEQNGLKPYTLCADDIRLLCQAPVLDIDGTRKVSQKNEKVVWRTLFDILETRMKRGEFTVIDATNTKTVEMNRYKDLAKKYRYRIYCVDMTAVPIEEAKRRNAERDPIKRVPEEAIDRAYARFANQKIPSGIKVIRPDELDTIWYKPIDLSEYEKIHVIGDIHGCYTALMEYMTNKDIEGYFSKECFIFVGDYLDRGLENVETLEWLMKYIRYPNVFFLEGNHEAHLRNWANDEDIASSEFRKVTQPKLEAACVNKKDVRTFCRALGQCCYFKYGKEYVLVTHGGISTMPDNLTFVATEQMIKGVGDYKDAHAVDMAFFATTSDVFYQIHGHRNETNEPIKVNDATWNLNGDVEFGGYLRGVTLSKPQYTINDDFRFWSKEEAIKNNIYRLPENLTKKEDEVVNADMDAIIEYMRASKYISEKTFGDISSFNFTRGAFEKGVWDGLTTKARGLYIDTVNKAVVARGYEKFFNYAEVDATKPEALSRNLVFPMSVYIKENGFLGIVSVDKDGDLIFASKSTLNGDHALMLKENLYNIYGADVVDKIRAYSHAHNVSFIFEVIDRERDPHIIKYKKNECILLDIIKNDIKFEKLSFLELSQVADEIGLERKQLFRYINDYHELSDLLDKINSGTDVILTDRIADNCIEGLVFEDASGFMFKLKTPYYNEWKMLRGIVPKIMRGGNINYTGALLSVESNYFYGWLREKYNTLDKSARWDYSKRDIISLRDEFREDMKTREKNNGND